MSTPSKSKQVSSTRPVILPLYHLRCAADAQTIERLLRQEPGVVEVYANPATEKVYVKYEPALTNPDRLKAVLQQAGFGQRTAPVVCGRCP
jgi:copper chaperone CopZ